MDVARAMLTVRGTGRSSHIAGAIVHNQRLDRTFGETYSVVHVTVCNALFYDMEDSEHFVGYK